MSGDDRAGTGGFSLSSTSTTWTAGTSVTISVAGTGKYEGIILLGFAGTTKVGTWSPLPAGHKLVSGVTNAVTQTTNAFKGPSVAFTWVPPAAGTGTVVFKMMLVVSITASYYVDNALTLVEAGANLVPS